MSFYSEKEYLIWMDALLKQGKEIQVPVRGMSMFPFLMKNDVVRVSPVKYEDLESGQIVIFESGSQWVAHRLISSDGGICHTRGDGNKSANKPVPFSEIKGVVTGIAESRWFLAKYALGRVGKLLIKTGPVSGWIFWHLGRISYAMISFYRKLKQ